MLIRACHRGARFFQVTSVRRLRPDGCSDSFSGISSKLRVVVIDLMLVSVTWPITTTVIFAGSTGAPWHLTPRLRWKSVPALTLSAKCALRRWDCLPRVDHGHDRARLGFTGIRVDVLSQRPLGGNGTKCPSVVAEGVDCRSKHSEPVRVDPAVTALLPVDRVMSSSSPFLGRLLVYYCPITP